MRPTHSGPNAPFRVAAAAVTQHDAADCHRVVAAVRECRQLIRLVVWGEAALVVANSSASGSSTAAHWRLLDRRLLVDRSPYAVIYDEDVQLPDGETIANFLRVELPPFVIMLVEMEDGTVPFVRQYRQGVR